MAMLTVRNTTDEVHRALRLRAAERGHGIEAEVRENFEAAVRPKERVKLGSLLADMGNRARLTDGEFTVLEHARSKDPARSVSFD